ncbi:ABC transporter ATP-binding protein [Rubrimonas sp.]|uniref:ABC transporter ATP-binding protein n=1 Tax=Rubrimonas sp. TaxID=2036015 RepID=UPI002FDDCC21
MIALRNVSKSYRAGSETRVLMRDVSLTLPRGRSVGLLGRNGAGKSTLLRMIGGSIMPDRGEIVRTVRVSWPLGFGGGFHGLLTGAQNARFVARIYGVDTDAMIESVADFAELGPFLHMPVSTYSSGMRARLAFGVSMAIDFDVYLVDEITAVGDEAFRRKCRAAFRAKSATADIVMVSHAPATIREYCDCGVVMEEGRLLYFEDVGEALALHHANMGT